MLDVVTTKDGQRFAGVITELNYSGKSDEENYILISQESGSIQKIKMSDFQNSSRERNNKYKPQVDVILQENEVLINGNKMSYVGVKEEKNDIIVLDSLCRNNNDINNAKLVVQYRQTTGQNVEMFQLVKITEIKTKKKETYNFTYKDLVNSTYRANKIETSVNGTTTVEYDVNNDGVFALYDSKNKRAIPFRILLGKK